MTRLAWLERAEEQLGKWSRAPISYYEAHRARALLMFGTVLGVLLLAPIYVVFWKPLPNAWGWAFYVVVFSLSGVHGILNRGWLIESSHRGKQIRPDKPVFAISCIATALHGYISTVLFIFLALFMAWNSGNWVLVGISFGVVALLTVLLILKIDLERRHLVQTHAGQ